MQREEFESLTGFRPTQGMYRVIANEYIKSTLDEAEFCRQYSLNIGGIAEKIQRIADMAEIEQRNEIAELQEQLDRELGWKYYADLGTYLDQEEYTEMFAKYQTVSDDFAIKILTSVFGFIPEQIKIWHEVQEFECNKYGVCRVKRTFQRDPVYANIESNYIRFDCAEKQWELIDGELIPYDC